MTERAGAPVARTVARNTAVQLAGKAVVNARGPRPAAVTTGYLGVSASASCSAFAFVQTFGLLADAGLLTVVVREISRVPERTDELVGSVLALRLALSLAVVPLAALASLALPYDREVRVAILIAGGSLVLGLANGALVAVFQARLRMGRAAVADVAGRLTAFAALAAVAALDLGFYAVVATAAVGAAVALALSWVLVQPLAHPRPSVDRAAWRALLVAALPVGAALAVTEIYFRADTFIISLFRDFDEVGAYSLAYRVIELLAVLPAVVMTSVFPLLSRYLGSGGSRERAAVTVEAAGDLFLAVGVPIAAGGLVVAPQLVELVAGDGFEEAVDPLRILLFAGALASVSGLLGYALIAGGRQTSALRLAIVALVFNLALNFALVPSLGVDAAAAVALGSELVMVAGGLWLVRRELYLRPRFRIAWRVVVAAAVMAALLALVPTDSLLVLLPLGIAIYTVVLYAVGGIDRRAIEALLAVSVSVLVLSAEAVAERMAGPAIRAAELARALAARPSRDARGAGAEQRSGGGGAARGRASRTSTRSSRRRPRHDVVLAQELPPTLLGRLSRLPVRIALDLYNPIVMEVLEAVAEERPRVQRRIQELVGMRALGPVRRRGLHRLRERAPARPLARRHGGARAGRPGRLPARSPDPRL